MFAYYGLNTLPRDFVAESAHRSAIPWALSPTARPVVVQTRPAFCAEKACFCFKNSRKLAKNAFSPSFAWATRATNGRGKRTLAGTNGGKGVAASGHKAKKRKGESPPQGAVRGLSRRFNIFPCRGSLSSFFRTFFAEAPRRASVWPLPPAPRGPCGKKRWLSCLPCPCLCLFWLRPRLMRLGKAKENRAFPWLCSRLCVSLASPSRERPVLKNEPMQ